jgi:hypothetical protein
MPRLVRRGDIPERGWVAFVFDYRGKRETAFIRHEALAIDEAGPESAFDSSRQRILVCAAEKTTATKPYPEGKIVLTAEDLPPLPPAGEG